MKALREEMRREKEDTEKERYAGRGLGGAPAAKLRALRHRR